MFSIDPEALARAEGVLQTDLPPLDVSRLSEAIVSMPDRPTETILDPILHRVFGEAAFEFHRLLEEYRFEAALAHALVFDYHLKHPDETSKPPSGPLPPSDDVIVLLLPYQRDIPPLSTFVGNPHSEFSGDRVLSLWFAAQLIDSAVFRGVAACD